MSKWKILKFSDDEIYNIHPPWKDREPDWKECERIFFKDHPLAIRMQAPYLDFPKELDLDDHRAVLARHHPTVVRWRNYFTAKYGEDLGTTFFLLFINQLILRDRPDLIPPTPER